MKHLLPFLLVLVAIGMSMIDYTERREKQHQQEVVALQQKNDKLSEQLDQQMDVSIENEQYEKAITQIVDTLVQVDSAYGLGGTTPDSVQYTSKEMLDTILNNIQNRKPDRWFEHVGQFFQSRHNIVSNTPNIWPIGRENFDRVTSGFGFRRSPINNRLSYHSGIDITSNIPNADILATADGIVSGVWQHHETFGKVIWITHKSGFVTMYGHLSDIEVQYKQEVERGQIIGTMGQTGVSDGIHLHYEIKKNRERIDPIKFMLIQ